MSIVVDRGSLGYFALQGTSFERTEHRFGDDQTADKLVSIGLLNNMPDPALQQTEQQFIKLIDSAAEGRAIHLSLFSLPKIPRTDWGRTYLERSYNHVSALRDIHLDGLIITGTEPRASNLRDEPFWAGLADVLDWAEDNTISSICSCLAAHAAVLHIDGIGRFALEDKCFGVFEQTKVCNHPILEGISSRFRFPHSRWNAISEAALASHGYEILATSPEAGVDTFAKHRKSLFIFFQGHPEYEARTLLGEYRRDIGRFLRGERETYPNMPRGYFDEETRAELSAFQEQALSDRREDLLACFPTVNATRCLKNTWQLTAERLYGNWISYLSTQRAQRVRNSCAAL
jgi:homoserine O-succinyltransferase/O-acetyltransferase